MAHWLPRLSLAATFLYHGLPKFAGGEMMGMPAFAIYLLALMEVGGALLILWGGFGPDWATRVSGLIFSVVMIGAIVIVCTARMAGTPSIWVRICRVKEWNFRY